MSDEIDKIISLAELCEKQGKSLRDFIHTLRFAYAKQK